ncbi:Uncharacterized protein Adt_11166 [Abeliophyllum distichum]|uniref:DUF4378 domain-containing protein n=1 Tax=Abeliophyllum distichum TaxID=126358 RepID=A0ABD1UM63_9LAMI
MGTKPHAESVIARLMSLDERPPQRPIHKQQRVFSESYLLKTASIGLREGGSFSIGHSRRVSSGRLEGIKDTFELQISKDQHGTQSVNDKSANLSTKKVQTEVLKLLPGPRPKYGEIFSKKSKWHAPGNVFRSLQKVENDSLAGHCGELRLGHMNNFLKSRLEMLDRSYHSSTRNSVFKSNSTKDKNNRRHVRSYLNPSRGYRDHGESLKAESGKLHNGVRYEEQVSNDKESLIHSFSAHNGTMNRSLQPSEFEVTSETFSNAFLRQDDGEMIAQKDSLGSRGSTGCEKFQPSLGADLCNDGTTSQSSMTSELSSCNFSCLSLNNNRPEAYSKGIQDATGNSSEKDNRCGDIEHGSRVSNLSISNVASRSTVDAKLANTRISSRIVKEKNCEPNPGIFSVIDTHYSDVWEAFSRQESSNEFFEEEFHETSKGINQYSPDCINQYSPDSVLSPHEIENSSTSECFESVATDFDSLFESEETHSESSAEMDVSSNDDMKNESDDLSQDKRILQWSFGYEESRNYSYLLDVLDEAGLDDVDLVDFSKTFHLQEYSLSPFVFEALEKKYSKQTSWKKSERKLLFDRINSGLREIITIPLIDFDKYTTPVRRRYSTTLNRDEVEEELWQLLISQEKENNKDLLEKVIRKEMKWFELEEDVNIIVRELESFLFDELAKELVCRIAE